MRPLNSSPVDSCITSVLTHWGLVIAYFDNVKTNWWIYEAFNIKGKLRAKRRQFEQAESDIPGAQLKLKMENTKVCQEVVEEYCDEKNAENADYNVMYSNCQEFVTDLLVELSLPSQFSFRDFLTNALSSSSKLSRSICSSVIKDILKPFLKAPAVSYTHLTLPTICSV